jgi:hypothetical protein
MTSDDGDREKMTADINAADNVHVNASTQDEINQADLCVASNSLGNALVAILESLFPYQPGGGDFFCRLCRPSGLNSASHRKRARGPAQCNSD